jgi:hypothetical protein
MLTVENAKENDTLAFFFTNCQRKSSGIFLDKTPLE